MFTFYLVLTVLILVIVFGSYFGLKARWHGDRYGVPAVIAGIITVAMLLVLWVVQTEGITTIIDAHARIETTASYKNQEGVYFLNKNIITENEYQFAVRYNQWLARQKYWNQKQFCDAFITDDVEKEQPIRFIIGDSRK